jgi:hypothetical protein
MWEDGAVTIDISRAEPIQGWMSVKELQWLAATAQACQVIVEVGSWKGRSTKALATHVSGLVYAVDHWRGSANDRGETRNEVAKRGSNAVFADFLSNLSREVESRKVIPIQAESSEAVQMLQSALDGEGAGLVFLDGDHAYESVKRDIKNYRQFVRKGGVFAGHDYSSTWPGVIKAVDEDVPGREVVRGETIWYYRVPE